VRDISSQIAVGYADTVYFSANGASWAKASTTAGLGPALAAVGASTGIAWEAVGSASVGSTLHVTLAGRLVNGTNSVFVKCAGPDTGAATWSCVKHLGLNTYYPISATVRTYFICKSIFPSACATYANYHAASLTYNSTAGNYATINFHDYVSSWVTEPAGSLPTASMWLAGDVLANSYVNSEVAGASTFWLVGSGGALYWRQGGSANEYLANVVANQGSYVFSGVANYAGHVLVFGHKPPPSGTQRIPVLLVHKDDANLQGKSATWTEFELQHPPYNSGACFSSGLVTGNAHAGPEALGLVANTCANSLLSKATSLRTAVYVRRYVP
jgi:hypothetical protein